MVSVRSQYKQCLRSNRYQFDKKQTAKLTEARVNNAKLYWQLLKQGSGLCKSNISLSVFEQYFNSVNNPESPFFTADEDILHFIDRYERNEFDIMFHELNLPFSPDEI